MGRGAASEDDFAYWPDAPRPELRNLLLPSGEVITRQHRVLLNPNAYARALEIIRLQSQGLSAAEVAKLFREHYPLTVAERDRGEEAWSAPLVRLYVQLHAPEFEQSWPG